MIQRKQSLFLLIAGVIVFLMYKLPVVVFTDGDLVYQLFACHVLHPETGTSVINVVPMAILPLLSAVLSFIAILKFNNRKLQMQMGKINMLVLFTLIAVEIIYFIRLQNIIEVNGNPAFSAVIPLIALILIYLANKAIKKDDDLVKSADRIR